MDDYSFLADMLNKYSQLTPWVQVSLVISLCVTVLGLAYFFKGSILIVVKPFYRANAPDTPEQKTDKKEWVDRYDRS